YNGRGVISDRHYLSHSLPAGHRLWATADVVLAIGTRLQQPLMNWGVDDGLTLVRIDVDPDEMTRIHAADAGIVADAGEALRALLPAVERHSRARPSRQHELAALKREIDD